MANLIREQRLVDSTKRALAKYVLVSDGTQNSNTKLLDASTLAFSLNANGYIAATDSDVKSLTRTTIKRISGQLASNIGRIKLQWHGAANSEIVTFGPGSFNYDFESMGDGATISNPETASNGDILISTTNLATGDLATIFLDLRKDARDFDAGQTNDPYAFNAIGRR